MKAKSLIAAIALATTFGVTVAPAQAKMMMSHKQMMMQKKMMMKHHMSHRMMHKKMM